MAKHFRTEASIRNAYYSIIWQVVSLILSFVNRYVFVKLLSSEYLGVEGLFTNILTVFSLADLGIGSAIVYALYKPIEEDNVEKIKSYMRFYGVCYRVIALVILVTGVVLLPNLKIFINGEITITDLDLQMIFILFVIDSSVSYLFVYKAQLLNATQNNYIYNICQMFGKAIMSAGMIVGLLLTRDFFVYLIVKVLSRILTNIILTWKTNKLFPYLLDSKVERLTINEKRSIGKNVYGLFLNQIGFVLINGTDNIILSKFVNIVAVALYSNYLLIINAASNMVGQLFNSIVASVGNLAVSTDKINVTRYFERIHFINFVFALILTVGIWGCIDILIELLFGADYILDRGTVVVIVINFYLQVMKNVVGTFKYACGVYWEDKYCTIIRAIFNVILSIIMVKYWGIVGVFLGTLISDLLTTFWYQPVILYKKNMYKRAESYFLDFTRYTMITILACLVVSCVRLFVVGLGGITKLFFVGIVSIAICIGLIFVFYRKTDEFLYLFELILKKILRKN